MLTGRGPSYNRGVPQLEDDACDWDAAGLLGTLHEIGAEGRASLRYKITLRQFNFLSQKWYNGII